MEESRADFSEGGVWRFQIRKEKAGFLSIKFQPRGLEDRQISGEICKYEGERAKTGKKRSLAKQHHGGGGGVFLNIYNSGLISAEPVEKGGRWAAGAKEEAFFIWALSKESIQATLLLWNVFQLHNGGHVEAFFCVRSTCKRYHCCYVFIVPPVRGGNQVEIRLIDFCLLCLYMQLCMCMQSLH